MTSTGIDGLIDNYLRRLDAALSGLPVARRAQLVSEIAEHLEEARSGLSDQTEVEVRRLLDRVGHPEDIAAEAMADEPTLVRSRPSRARAMVLLGVALLLALGIGLTVLFVGQEQSTPKAPPPTTTKAPPPTVSKYVPLVMVPVVLGFKVEDAEAVFRDAGLNIEIISVPDRAGDIPGEVVAQAPVANSNVSRGSEVTIRVASSP